MFSRLCDNLFVLCHIIRKPNISRCLSGLRYSSHSITNAIARQKRCNVFGQEKARQLSLISRIEKIEVHHVGPPEDCVLLMNKGLSTPFNCAMHIQELLMTRSVVALVNGQPWDMHRPIVADCELRFLHFKDNNPSLCNEALWRTGSFLLGFIADRAFRDEHFVELCSFPRPDVSSGSFVYDVDLKIPEWKPTQAELSCLSRIASKLQAEDLLFEQLDIDASVALRMFENNRYKSSQIPQIAAQSATGSTVTVYRLHDHVDITRGPLISNTQQIGRFSVTAIHNIYSPDFGTLKRLQGLAIPRQLPIHFWSYELLCNRAANLNEKAPIPHLPSAERQAASQ
jgi:large subunit ribosomal protein L39